MEATNLPSPPVGDYNFLQFRCEQVATFCRISVYALAQYVPRCNQQTIAAKKAGDTGISRHVPTPLGIDLYAISLARRTPEQNQRRIQGQPSTGINQRRATNETTPGGRCGSYLEP